MMLSLKEPLNNILRDLNKQGNTTKKPVDLLAVSIWVSAYALDVKEKAIFIFKKPSISIQNASILGVSGSLIMRAFKVEKGNFRHALSQKL